MLEHDALLRGEATMPGLLRHHAQQRGDRIALREKVHGIWQGRTWSDYYRQARRTALGLM
jgi:long-chain acyl-CoA synthetase